MCLCHKRKKTAIQRMVLVCVSYIAAVQNTHVNVQTQTFSVIPLFFQKGLNSLISRA